MSEASRKIEEKSAHQLLRETRKLQKKFKKKLEENEQKELQEAIDALSEALDKQEKLSLLTKDLEQLATRLFAPYRKSVTREYVESILIAVAVALLLRTFVVEPFKIPSGSMIPTLAIGDHIFVNKLSYGLWIPFAQKKLRFGAGPKRGDVIVFIYPKDPTKDFIKRVVGLPGDTIEVRNNVVFINKKKIGLVKKHMHTYKEQDEMSRQWYSRKGRVYIEDLFGVKHTLLQDENAIPSNRNWSSFTDAPQNLRSWGPKVKPGFVFVMGDNRDHSSDSREWGLVPVKNIKGRAVLVWLSYGGGRGIRFDRFFTLIK